MKKLVYFFLSFILTNSYGQDAEYYLNLAKEKIELNDYQYALTLIDKSIEIDKNNQWSYLTKADIVFKLYGSDEAIDVINQSIKLNPLFAEQYNRAGSYYQSAGKINFSLLMYNEAIRLEGNDTIKYNYIMNRGTAKGQIRDFLGAKIDLEEVYKFNPEDIAILTNLGHIYHRLGMINEAIGCYKKAFLIDSTFHGAIVNLGFIYSSIDSLDLALECFNNGLRIKPNDPLAYNNMGYVYYKKKDYFRALTQINKSLDLYPSNSYAYRNLGLVYLAQGNIYEACTAFNYALSYDFTAQYGNEVEELLKSNCNK